MTATVPGIYKQGTIELLEKPYGIREGRVVVTLIEDQGAHPEPRFLQFGKYSGGRMSTEEDFKIAEWHGEDEWEN